MPSLWRFHQIHHSDVTLGPLTTFRFHLVEIGWRMFTQLLALHLLAVTSWDMPVTLVFLPLLLEVLAHSDLDWSYGPFGRLIVSPHYHRLHHAADVRANANFGMLLTFWDAAFGTRAAEQPIAGYGLADEQEVPATFSGQFVHPFRTPNLLRD